MRHFLCYTNAKLVVTRSEKDEATNRGRKQLEYMVVRKGEG